MVPSVGPKRRAGVESWGKSDQGGLNPIGSMASPGLPSARAPVASLQSIGLIEPGFQLGALRDCFKMTESVVPRPYEICEQNA